MVPISLHCAIQELKVGVEQGLAAYGLTTCNHAHWHLILDAPFGWAFLKLVELEPSQTIIVSDNPCPEYKCDLHKLGPVALLNRVSIEKLVAIIKQIQTGERHFARYPLPHLLLKSA